MDAIVAALAGIGGVIVGSFLNAWYAHRAEIRTLFNNALAALADVASAMEHPRGINTGDEYDPHLSERLEQRLTDDLFEALVRLRQALAAVEPWCPEIDEYLSCWHQHISSAEEREKMRTALRGGMRRERSRRHLTDRTDRQPPS